MRAARCARRSARRRGVALPAGCAWEAGARAFLEAYDDVARQRAVRHDRRSDALLELFELEKALYELRYELEQPARLGRVPLRAARSGR